MQSAGEVMMMHPSTPRTLGNFHHGLENGSRQLHTGRAQALVEFGADAGGAEPPGDSSGFGEPGFLKYENVLHGDQLAFHAHAFGYVRDARSEERRVGEAWSSRVWARAEWSVWCAVAGIS